MIDLHCHILPGIDDGPKLLATSIEMARMAQDDGIVCTACTPHIYPGVYENEAKGIKKAVATLQTAITEAGLSLQLTYGADTHLVPDMLAGLRTGRIPTLNGSRYFLLEPSHHAHPPQFLHQVSNVMSCGYIPLITHPERFSWADEYYDEFTEAVNQGAWLQITSGAILGRFGRGPRYLAEQMLDDGIVHIIATDAHDHNKRYPRLAEGRDAAAKWVGEIEANRMVIDRPKAVLTNAQPNSITPCLAYQKSSKKPVRSGRTGWSLFGNWLGNARR